jgi:1-acyl-sn-glycerol-3-phosphate acyltransferase
MRLVFAWIFFVVSTFAFFPLTVLAWFVSPGGTAGAWLTRHWARGLLKAGGVRWVVRGREIAPRKKACVIVANHASMLDISVCSASLPVLFHFVSRPFFFKVPLVGWGMVATRQIGLDPKKPREASRVLRDLGKRFRRGTSVLLFPEGTRSPDGRIRRYKRGPFVTAIRCGVPVLPVSLDGVQALLPKKSFRLRPGVVNVTIGEPIPTEGMEEKEAGALAERVEAWTREAAR